MVLVEQQVLGVVVALETSDLDPVQHLWIHWPNHSDPQRLHLGTQRA